MKDLTEHRGILQRHALLHTLFFVLGFSVIFVALGLSASLVGEIFSNNRDLIRQLGAIVVIIWDLLC